MRNLIKILSIIYADLEFFIKNIHQCKNNSENSYTEMSTIWAFDDIENKYDVWRGGDCMKRFCEPLREYIMKIVNFENETINK